MNKRALMLSAATASLLAGQVLADTDISKQVTTPQTTSQDGNITIESDGSIVITTSHTQDSFLISVRDTGAGIPEAIRSRIFDPFFTTKPIGKGTGLGLAISYGIIQDHRGSIDVHSEEGAGAEFTIRIPLNLESRRKP